MASWSRWMSRPAIGSCSGKWSGTEVKIDGDELLVMKESDIMGVIEGTAKATRKAA